MKYSELLNNNLIKAGKFSAKQVEECFGISRRDLDTAKKIQGENDDWAYNIAYNAMLQAARGLMFSKGYRPAGEAQHVTVIKFLEITLDKSYKEKLEIMDMMRRKRNKNIYDMAGIVSEIEVEEAVKTAGNFVKNLAAMLKIKI
jgi:uncharacterized protein (UPF0332 family)